MVAHGFTVVCSCVPAFPPESDEVKHPQNQECDISFRLPGWTDFLTVKKTISLPRIFEKKNLTHTKGVQILKDIINFITSP